MGVTIYHAMQNKGEKYTVLSSATEDRTKMGEIPMCTINNKPLKVFEVPYCYLS